MASKTICNRLLGLAVTASFFGLGGCSDVGQNVGQYAKNIGDYLNLRNSFLDPSQVGRFDKAMPWGISKPVTWPILEQLDMIDEPNNRWSMATDPLPSDLVSPTKEYVVGEGDTIRVSVYELVTPGLDYFREAEVNELGNITMVNLNQVHVAGLTPTEIEERVAKLAVDKGFLLPKGNGNPGPQVSVTLLHSQAKVFSILGQVGAPGEYPIVGTDFRLLEALALGRDIAGGTQAGMDYLYVFRPVKGAGIIPAASSGDAAGTTTAPAGNPLDTLDNLRTPSRPAPSAPPATTRPSGTPGASVPNATPESPQFLRPLPTAMVSPSAEAVLLAQADLDAAVGSGGAPASGSRPPATPTAAGSTGSAAAPAAAPASGTSLGTDLLNRAVGSTSQPGQFIYVDGKWVPVGSSTGNGTAGMSQAEVIAAATGLDSPRVIRIPINALVEGDPRYNIVIHPGDVIRIPNIESGEFYMMGHVGRGGVYSLTGRKVTLKQAVAAAGGLDAVAIPRRCDLIRRIGTTEVTVQIDLQKIFDGEQPDIYLKPNDLVNVGTDIVAPFLAVTRNAYRFSYGFGFVYDRNFFIQPTAVQSVTK